MKAYTCAACGQDIRGSAAVCFTDGGDWATDDIAARLLCGKCSGSTKGRIHSLLYPDCPVTWHDIYDHRGVHSSRFVINALTESHRRAEIERRVGTEATVSDLIQSGTCSPVCLLGAEDGSCRCRCGGRWHGTLDGDAIIVSQRVVEHS